MEMFIPLLSGPSNVDPQTSAIIGAVALVLLLGAAYLIQKYYNRLD